MRMTLHMTRRCNLKCTYCYAECAAGSAPKVDNDMTLETAQRAVDLLLARSEQRAHLVFFGGEPVLRLDRIEATMRYGREAAGRAGKRLSFELTTNGTVGTERLIALVRRYSATVAVSIDGPREVHDTHRVWGNGLGSFDRIDRNLDRMLAEIPWLIASSVVTPHTVGQLSRSVGFLLERGFRIVVTSPDHSAQWTQRHVRVLRGEVGRIGKLYERHMRRGKKFFLSCIDSAIRTHVRGDSEESASCGAGRSHLSVSPSGTLYPCVQFVGSEQPDSPWALGDVRGGVDPARQQALLPQLSGSSSECGGCELKQRCASGCPCANLAATGRLDRVSPIQCSAQRVSIPTADRAAMRLYRKRQKHFIHKHYNRLYPVAMCVEEAITQKELRS